MALFSGTDSSAQDAQIIANRDTLQYSADMANLARQDIGNIFPPAQQDLNQSFQNAYGMVAQGVPQQLSAVQQGNMAAQGQAQNTFDQQRNAIMGTGVDSSTFAPQGVNVDTSFMNQYSPSYTPTNIGSANYQPNFSSYGGGSGGGGILGTGVSGGDLLNAGLTAYGINKLTGGALMNGVSKGAGYIGNALGFGGGAATNSTATALAGGAGQLTPPGALTPGVVTTQPLPALVAGGAIPSLAGSGLTMAAPAIQGASGMGAGLSGVTYGANGLGAGAGSTIAPSVAPGGTGILSQGLNGFATNGSMAGLGAIAALSAPILMGLTGMPSGKAHIDALNKAREDRIAEPILNELYAGTPAGMTYEDWIQSRQRPQSPYDMAVNSITGGDRQYQEEELASQWNSPWGQAQMAKYYADNPDWFTPDGQRINVYGA